MSQGNKTLSGILSFLPFVAFIAYMIPVFGFFLQMGPQITHHDGWEEANWTNFVYIFGFAIVLGIVSLGVLVYFIIHVVNNKQIDSTERLVWVLIFIFTGMIGYPIYWYLRIHRNQTL